MVENATAVRIHVHDNAHVLDGMLRLVELARQRRPLDARLSAMCELIAKLADVDVVSVYLREQQVAGEMLVMRGNVGFPPDAVGRVQLGLYEGLTGVVAERRRPITVARAQTDDRYKHVDGIGEEQFAAYLGVPLLLNEEVAGVLVLQRRAAGAVTEAHLSLASSLTAPLIFAIERDRPPTAASYFAGKSLVRGRAVGPVLVLPPPSMTPPASGVAALHALEFDLVTAAQRLGHAGPGVARALDNAGLVAIALRDQVASAQPGDALSRLQRVPYHSASGTKDLTTLVAERDREVSDLYSFLVADTQHRLSICGSVLVVKALGSFMALEAVARGAVAVLVATTAEDLAREILEAADVPCMTATPELLAKLQGGEVLEVDATQGYVRVIERST